MSLGEDQLIGDKTTYGLGVDESYISAKQVGKNLYASNELRDAVTKDFCDKNKNFLLCQFRNFFIMLAVTLIGLLILYVFIRIITTTTKKNLLKSISKISK